MHAFCYRQALCRDAWALPDKLQTSTLRSAVLYTDSLYNAILQQPLLPPATVTPLPLVPSSTVCFDSTATGSPGDSNCES